MNGPSYVVSQGMNFWRERYVVVDADTGELVRLATSADLERPTRESDDSWSEARALAALITVAAGEVDRWARNTDRLTLAKRRS